jgi:RimJ/RimL family protein N-acetyltransferase
MPDSDPFVPEEFEPPTGLVTERFALEPLGPQHTAADYEAWTSSMEHIAATPGFTDSSWPREMTQDENRADLERHARDFQSRTGFTYTVLDPDRREVIGCVYIYPSRRAEHDASVLLWVRASHADLDQPLWEAVRDWLAARWPFTAVETHGRS